MRKNSNKSSGNGRKSFELSALEPRILFCGDHAATPVHAGGYGSHTTTVAPSSSQLNVPVLNSNLGAKATLYLDFDGEASGTWGNGYNTTTTPAYDTDGNAGTFSAGEFASINEIFQRISEKFSPFNMNVTTVNPGTFADGKALHVVIGGAGGWTGVQCGGISYVGSFANSAPNVAYAFSDNLGGGYPKYVAEAIAHESGHAFGLQHQSSFSLENAKTEEYNSGNGDTAPIMGNSYSSSRGLWWSGESSTSSMQDDMSVIANSTNGFGYRNDEYGNTVAAAKPTKFSNGKFAIKGVISSLADRDMFRITFGGGTLLLKLRASTAGSMLDVKFRLYRADGSTVVATDSPVFNETITRSLPAGNYYAMVYSHGSYGDVGQYTMSAYSTPAAPASVPTHSMSATFSSTPIGSSVVDQTGSHA